MKNYIAYRAIYLAPFKGVWAVWRFLLNYYRRFRESVTTRTPGDNKFTIQKGNTIFILREVFFETGAQKLSFLAALILREN